MVTAFLSLALNRAVRDDVAMTGEISLTGIDNALSNLLLLLTSFCVCVRVRVCVYVCVRACVCVC